MKLAYFSQHIFQIGPIDTYIKPLKISPFMIVLTIVEVAKFGLGSIRCQNTVCLGTDKKSVLVNILPNLEIHVVTCVLLMELGRILHKEFYAKVDRGHRIIGMV